ncbi:hypothetical protein TTHERM_00322750 (macronuclear) [Tetrahymena thermophila SB210]|uniref:Uncharacterized protein n=1 Tax=Tetrahymena thermophila (strain SB210) TaxID=312017 RepID=Q237L0_TETTS|nr:hypothetical protein TTHERM_00322750 [Tetrahymena thermophila SB210]EAR92731.2 hypothetical protein TTHERM_00322750 [Tetrahymena thermophila SB210]|eukprot:XP_001012976.2 hypothetical protein TTHERM_00322750 [Tetrahymena thermophila SB210]
MYQNQTEFHINNKQIISKQNKEINNKTNKRNKPLLKNQLLLLNMSYNRQSNQYMNSNYEPKDNYFDGLIPTQEQPSPKNDYEDGNNNFNYEHAQNASTLLDYFSQDPQHEQYGEPFYSQNQNEINVLPNQTNNLNLYTNISEQQGDNISQQNQYPSIGETQEFNCEDYHNNQYSNHELYQQPIDNQQQQQLDNQFQQSFEDSGDNLQQQDNQSMFFNIQIQQPIIVLNTQNQTYQPNLPFQSYHNLNLFDIQTSYPQQNIFQQTYQQPSLIQNYQPQPILTQLIQQFDFNANNDSYHQYLSTNMETANHEQQQQVSYNKTKNIERKQDFSQYEAQPNKKFKVEEQLEQDIQIANQSNQTLQIIRGEKPIKYLLDGSQFNLKNFYKNIMKKISQYLVSIYQAKGQKKIVEFIKNVFPQNKCNNKHFLLLFNHLQQNNDPSTSIVNKIESEYEFSQEDQDMLEQVREEAQKLFSNKFYYLTRIHKAHKASKNIEQFYYGAVFYAERATQQQFSSQYIPFKEEQTIFRDVQSDLSAKLYKSYENQNKTKNTKNNQI